MFEESDCDSDNIPLIPSSRTRRVRAPQRSNDLNPRRRQRNVDVMRKKEQPETALQTGRSLGDPVVNSSDSEYTTSKVDRIIGYSNTICSGTFKLLQEFDKNNKYSRILWTLLNGDIPLIYARSLGTVLRKVVLSSLPIDPNNPKYNTIITINDSGSEFNSDNFSASYWNIEGNDIVPRRSMIKTIDGEFHHMFPSKTTTGQLMLNFEGHKVIPSCRNAIILNNRGNRCIYIRKVKANLFEIDVLIPLHLETIIDIGISSCIYDK